MKKAIINGTIITGDGFSQIDDSILIINDRKIEAIVPKEEFNYDYPTIDAKGNYVMPGIVNTHAHGIIPESPLFSSGSKELNINQVIKNINKHLEEGTTSILNVDSFTTIDNYNKIKNNTPANIKIAIANSDSAYNSAFKIDGSGIKETPNIEDVLNTKQNCIAAIGEGGSGATLGGGVQDYKFIPEKIKQKYGIEIERDLAKKIKEAVLGRYIKSEDYNENKLKNILSNSKLSQIEPSEIKKDIEETVLPPFNESIESLMELYHIANDHNLPYIVHNSAASKDVMRKLANSYAKNIIAGHSNHGSFTLEESINFAKELKEKGCTIDIGTFNALDDESGKKINYFMTFLKEGIADTISTDYGGGNHSSILSMVDIAIKEYGVNLPYAISLATKNPAEKIPLLGKSKGFISSGYQADIIICDKNNLGNVKYMMIEGNEIYDKINK